MLYPLVFTALCFVSRAKKVTYDFDIGWVSAAPDGYSRPVIGINGQWPIPTIEANVHDEISVTVHNSLGNQSTGLHFHGMHQVGSTAYDGAIGVVQCPLAPNQSFTYTFKAWPAGTHWYHSHDRGQYPDGLRGKMIIHDPDWETGLDVDEQIYLSMSDWYHTEMPYLINDYMSPDNKNGDIQSPDAFLVDDTTQVRNFTFETGKRYLLRIASISALACGDFHIDGHLLSVVAVDGVPVVAKDVNTIIICAGQRYDVVVTGHSNSSSSFQWVAKMTTDMLTHDIPAAKNITVIGALKYNSTDPASPFSFKNISSSWTARDVLDDTTLTPSDNKTLLTGVNNKITFITNQTYYDGIGSRISVAAQPWVEPKVPTLYTALTTGSDAMSASTYGPGAAPQILRSGDIVQIYMENAMPYPHPMHLHGHAFQVAGRGFGVWSGNESSLATIPMRRDTVVIPARGYIVLRFVADNPGIWFFHCHIDFHNIGGMAATFIEAPDRLQKRGRIPAAGKDLCASSQQCSSGNCACGDGAISASDASEQCNTVYNVQGPHYGALIVDS